MNTRLPIWPLLFGALLLAGAWQDLAAQHRLTVQPESRLWIEGTSTVNAFTCRSQDVTGFGFLERSTPEVASAAALPEAPTARAEVTVRVETFDCGKQRMNQDFYTALKAEAHPMIRFDLERTAVLPTPLGAEVSYQLGLSGWLTIAGTPRRIEMTVRTERLADGRYRVEGSRLLLMSDFGIEPPTAMLGLIRAHDRILVRFDLVAAPSAIPTQTTHSTQ